MVKGESLADDMEGCGDELVLRRACAPGGGWPKEKVEIIRPGDERLSGLSAGRDMHRLSILSARKQSFIDDNGAANVSKPYTDQCTRLWAGALMYHCVNARQDQLWNEWVARPAAGRPECRKRPKRSAFDTSSDRTAGCVRAGKCVFSESWAPRSTQ